MARITVQQTNFTGGEVSPFLRGRTDLRAYENGAARLRNVIVHPAGGVSRRSGLRYVHTARGRGRLIAFEFNTEQVYLLLLTDRGVDVFETEALIASLPTPWTVDQLPQIQWTQSADTLLIVHPDVAPKALTRASRLDWRLGEWTFVADADNRLQMPHHKFAADDVGLARSGGSGSIVLSAAGTAPHVFHPDHVGCRFRFANKEVEIVDVAGAGGNWNGGWYDKAIALAKQTLWDTPTTSKDWSEQAFSTVRGWPVSTTFHQDRLVIGGSRDLPNRLWLSKSGDLYNFDLGTGLDDEAIAFAILSDQVNAIRAVFAGRHLHVFTSGAEWMVSGEPLTPTNIQVHRQTRIGSSPDRSLPPRDVDGATVFVPRLGNQVREFVFTDIEQAYQAADLSFLSQHLIRTPVDLDYDQANRLLYVVMADGSLATLTNYRLEHVTAWTLQETAGRFLAVAAVGDAVFVLVERTPHVFVEVFDPKLSVDAGLDGSSANPTREWGGLDHLEGREVKVVADGSLAADAQVAGGRITLDRAVRSTQVGLGFTHVIEPLPATTPTLAPAVPAPTRTRQIAVSFHLLDSHALSVDRGSGAVDIPLRQFGDGLLDVPPPAFSGDKTVRTIGWRSRLTAPPWRIVQDTPLPFTLLAVATRLGIGDLE